jgi:hypothetical protein
MAERFRRGVVLSLGSHQNGNEHRAQKDAGKRTRNAEREIPIHGKKVEKLEEENMAGKEYEAPILHSLSSW